MSIKEYKLEELCNSFNPKSLQVTNKGDIPVYKISNFLNESNLNFITYSQYSNLEKKPSYNDILISRVGTIGEVFIINKKLYFTDNFIWLSNFKKELINPKYLYYLLNKNKKIFKKMNSGSTQPLLVKSKVLNIKLKLPDLKTQESIIDIIEPFEKISNNIDAKLNSISKIIDYINQYLSMPIGKMVDNNVIFEKGINIKSCFLTDKKTDIVFINVSCINGKTNKYVAKNCDFNENVNYGDVILSLDGTIGLCNNFLKGVNGYGYKVYSKFIHNSLIYFSLRNDINKKIMLNNSNGSVIKHSSKSKEELLLFTYRFKNEIEKIYSYEIYLKKLSSVVSRIINLLINTYVN